MSRRGYNFGILLVFCIGILGIRCSSSYECPTDVFCASFLLILVNDLRLLVGSKREGKVKC